MKQIVPAINTTATVAAIPIIATVREACERRYVTSIITNMTNKKLNRTSSVTSCDDQDIIPDFQALLRMNLCETRDNTFVI